MKVGDLVKCIWQPAVSKVVAGRAVPMKYMIKGELGIIVKQHGHYYRIFFPRFGYEHDLSHSAFEVINESR